MQTKELETLHHAPLDPRQQRTKTCFPGFEKSAFSVFRHAAMFVSAVPFEHVVARKPHMTQLTSDRCRSDGLARLV